MAVDAAVIESGAGAPAGGEFGFGAELDAAYKAAMAEGQGGDGTAALEPAASGDQPTETATAGAPADGQTASSATSAQDPGGDTDEPGELPEALKALPRSQRGAVWEFARTLAKTATEELAAQQAKAAEATQALEAIKAAEAKRATELRETIGTDEEYHGLLAKVKRGEVTQSEWDRFQAMDSKRETLASFAPQIEGMVFGKMSDDLSNAIRAGGLDPSKVRAGAADLGSVVANAIKAAREAERAEWEPKLKAANERAGATRMREAGAASAPPVGAASGAGQLPWSAGVTDEIIARAAAGEFRGLHLGES